MNIHAWKLDEIIGRNGYDALIERLGGAALARSVEEERRARLALHALLEGAARDRLITFADAVTDAAATREDAATRAGLCYGVALGAALVRNPAGAAEDLQEVAAHVASAVLGGELAPRAAGEVASSVLDALVRVLDAGPATPPLEADRFGATLRTP